MKQTWKKIIGLILISVCILAMTACGKNSSEETSSLTMPDEASQQSLIESFGTVLQNISQLDEASIKSYMEGDDAFSASAASAWDTSGSSLGSFEEIKDGKIYSSTVTSINPSIEGNPGEKNAIYNSNDIFGNITENSTSGIFGTYKTTIPQNKLYKVAQPSEIKPGEASILTVTKGEEIKEYKINILKINKDTKSTKNMLFEVTDNELLKISGGIVQGMSGSPIIQGDNIIGAVTHVVVDDCTKGYGIFIENMLENLKKD